MSESVRIPICRWIRGGKPCLKIQLDFCEFQLENNVYLYPIELLKISSLEFQPDFCGFQLERKFVFISNWNPTNNIHRVCGHRRRTYFQNEKHSGFLWTYFRECHHATRTQLLVCKKLTGLVALFHVAKFRSLLVVT